MFVQPESVEMLGAALRVWKSLLSGWLWNRCTSWEWQLTATAETGIWELLVSFLIPACFPTLLRPHWDMLWLLQLIPSSCQPPLVKLSGVSRNIFLPPRCNLTPTLVAGRHGGTFFKGSIALHTFAPVISDLVPGEREQVPHQPHGRRLSLIRADPQSDSGDPLQRGGSGEHGSRPRSEERHHLLSARWVETSLSFFPSLCQRISHGKWCFNDDMNISPLMQSNKTAL